MDLRALAEESVRWLLGGVEPRTADPDSAGPDTADPDTADEGRCDEGTVLPPDSDDH